MRTVVFGRRWLTDCGSHPKLKAYTGSGRIAAAMTVAFKNNNRTPLVVPAAVRRRAGFKSGQELEIKASGGVITILPKLPAADDEYTPAERRAIDRGIAASERDYREGRSYGPFESHEEFIAALHREAARMRGKKKSKSAVK